MPPELPLRLDSPRVAPLSGDELTPEQAQALRPVTARGPALNIFRTLARSPKALSGFLPWGSYVLSRQNDLPSRERELVILRTGWLCRSGYEWAQHVAIGRRSGLSDSDLERIAAGPKAEGLSELDSVLLRAVDELHADQFICESSWRQLRARLSEKACMDLVFTVAQYTQVSMILNSFGVQLENGDQASSTSGETA